MDKSLAAVAFSPLVCAKKGYLVIGARLAESPVRQPPTIRG